MTKAYDNQENAEPEVQQIRRVLVVDDDEGLNNLSQKALRKAGFQTEGVLTGAEAIERVVADPNLVLLLDQKLPDMQGTELIRSLYKEGYRLPFVAMTGHGDEKTAVELMKMGARDYLVKGLNLTDLLPEVFGRLFQELETEKKLALTVKELKKREERYTHLFNSGNDAVFVYPLTNGKPGKFIEVNDIACSRLGYSRKELLELAPEDVGAEGMEDIRNHALKTLAETGNCTFEIFHRCKSGSQIPVEVSSRVFRIEGQTHVISVARDISERRRAEQQQRQNELRLKALWSVASVREYDFQTINNHILHEIVEMTESQYGFYGFLNADETVMTVHSWNGAAMENFSVVDNPVDFLVSEAGIWAEAIRLKKPLMLNDYSAKHPAKKGFPLGHVPLTNLLVVPFFSDGRITALAAVANKRTDYTQEDIKQIISFLGGIESVLEKKRAEKKIRESNQLLSGVLEHTRMMAVYLDKYFNFIWVNQAYADTCKHEPSFFPGKNHFDLYPHEENQEIFQRIVDTGESFFVEARPFEFPDQPERGVTYWDWSLIPIKDDAGKVTGLVFTLHEVTERKRAEVALWESEQNLEALINASPEAAFLVDKRGMIVSCNSVSADRLGLQPGDMIGRRIYDLLTPELASSRRKFLEQVIQTGKPLHFEDVRDSRSISSHLFPVLDDHGNVNRVAIFGHDITEYRNAEKNLQKQKNLLSAIQETQDLFISGHESTLVYQNMLHTLIEATGSAYGFLDEVLHDPDGTPYKLSLALSDISWNDESRRLYQELVNQNLEFRNLNNLAGAPILENQTIIANDVSRHPRSHGIPKGHPPLTNYMGIPLYYGKEIIGVAGVANCPDGYTLETAEFIKPLTQACAAMIWAGRIARKEKENQKALAASEEQYRLLAENATDMITRHDANGIFIYVSPICRNLLGYEPEELIGCNPYDLLFPEDVEIVRKSHRVILEGPITYSVSYRLKHKSGHYVWVETTSRTIHDFETNEIKEIVAITRDITERKQAEEALRRSEEKFRSIAEQTSDLIALTDTQGIVTFASPACKSLYQIEPKEMCGRHFTEFLDDSVIPKATSAFHNAIERNIKVKDLELVMKRKDGSVFFGELCGSLFQCSGENGSLVVIRDITERKQAEKALQESERQVRAKLDAVLSPEGDIGSLNLTDVLDTEALDSILDEFFNITGIGVGVLDLEGKVLVAKGWQDICTRFHRCHAETEKNCIESDLYLSRGAVPGEYREYRCKNNMLDLAAPIILGGKHLGNIFLGQFFYSDEEPDYEVFRAQAQKYGFNREEYLAALDRVPRWDRETVKHVMHFYSRFACFISYLSYGTLKLARSLERQRNIEKELRDSEELFRTVFEQSAVGIAQVRPDGHFMEINSQFCEIIGYTKDKLYNLTFEDITHPEDLKKEFEIINRVLAGEIDTFEIEKRYIHKEGNFVWVRMLSNVVRDAGGEIKYAIVAVVDISEQKKVQEELRESERQKNLILNSTSEMIAYYNPDFKVIWANRASGKSMGLPVEELIGRYCYDIWCQGDEPSEDCPVLKARESKTPQQGERQTPDGRYWFLRGFPVLDENGQIEALVEFGQEITEKKKAQDALTRQQRAITLYNHIANVFLTAPQEEIFSQVLNVILEALESRFGYFAYIDDDGNLVCPSMTRDVWEKCGVADKSIIFLSEEWGGLWGKSLLEKRTLMANQGLQLPEGHIQLENALAVPIVHHGKLIGQFVVANKLGGYNQYDQELLESAAAQTAPVLAAQLEETRQRQAHEKLEEQYRQAQKLESVGRLAGGVAHDFNNMLSLIMGHAELAIDQLDPSNPLYESFQEIINGAQRSADLTRQLLAFARKQTISPKVINLNRVVEGMLKMLRRLIGEDIDLSWMPGEDLWRINVDPTQIDQVLANLCVNARDAISGVGKITIETTNFLVDEVYCSEKSNCVPGEYVQLVISDNGCGMDKETLNQIFEPFFTTKGMGEGTGLGLATVYGIVKQNKGFIDVYSELGHGTAFKIFLPRYVGKTDPIKKKNAVSAAKIGHETILLVEDEPAILKMSVKMLEKQGYKVLAANTPGEAIELAEIHGGQIDLLMTDVIMPEMNGRDLARRILSIYPSLKRLFMSGYTADVIAHHGVLDKEMCFIQKPFTKKELTSKVREVLDQD